MSAPGVPDNKRLEGSSGFWFSTQSPLPPCPRCLLQRRSDFARAARWHPQRELKTSPDRERGLPKITHTDFHHNQLLGLLDFSNSHSLRPTYIIHTLLQNGAHYEHMQPNPALKTVSQWSSPAGLKYVSLYCNSNASLSRLC